MDDWAEYLMTGERRSVGATHHAAATVSSR